MYTAVESMRELFQSNVMYVIPRFQRQYAWAKENWESLWEDVVAATDRLAQDDSGPRHFLGAIVLGAEPAASSHVHHVVDGQQRLMTLQLLSAAICGVARERGIPERFVASLRRLVVNDTPATVAAPATSGADTRLKLWPSRNDQGPFREAMTVHAPARDADRTEPAIVQAYDHFAGRVRSWLAKHRREAQGPAVERLATVLRDGLHAVVIRLDMADDPQVVFERLNARRLPLQASDFVRNHLFAVARSRGLPADWLYDEHWARFDDDYWRASPTPAGRPRIDDFLSHFLVMEAKRSFQSYRLFAQFTHHLATAKAPLDAIMARIAEHGEIYRRLDTLSGLDEADRPFAEHLHVMEISSVMPIVLWLYGSASPDERRQALAILDSYLVRRMIVGAPTNSYGDLTVQLLRQVETATRPADALRGYLAAREAKSNYWPGDAEIIHTLTRTPIADAPDTRRLRMLLKIIESHLRDPRNEQVDFDAGKLTVEHLMPIAWRDHWPLNGESPGGRNQHVHTLGNLALVTDELNKHLRNRPWGEKLPLIRSLSMLRLNQDLDETWTIPAIRARGQRLAHVLCGALERPADPVPVRHEPPRQPAPATATEEDSEVSAQTEPAPAATPLEHNFHLQVARLYSTILQELNHRASALLELVNHHGGLATAKKLLTEPTVSDATRVVIARGRPDLSVEAIVLKDSFAPLFTKEELATARARLP